MVVIHYYYNRMHSQNYFFWFNSFIQTQPSITSLRNTGALMSLINFMPNLHVF